MAIELTSHYLPSEHGPMHYLLGGPSDGPLMVFIHGWPGIALTWRPQLLHFAAKGFRVAAMDMLGYGKSPRPTDTTLHYTCRALASHQLALLTQLNRPSAIFVGHDWGCGPLWSLASHHPTVCTAIISLCVPYRTLELGVQHLITLSTRTLYPPSLYPHAQWDYMIAYETNPDAISSQLAAHTPLALKALFSKGHPSFLTTPSMTASLTTATGGAGVFFPPATGPPDIPVEYTVLAADPELHDQLLASLAQPDTWWCATAYYRNHGTNAAEHALDKLAVDQGRLEMPLLHVDAAWDGVCSAVAHPGMVREMRERGRDVEVKTVEAGHWVGLERKEEVCEIMEEWLRGRGLLPLGKEGESEGGKL